jgi:N-acetylneuraminic acid mutarotase
MRTTRFVSWAVVVSLHAACATAAEPAAGPTWTAKAKGCTQRFAHGAVWDDKRQTMLVFGGEGRDKEAFVFFNDLWTYSPTQDRWQDLTAKGDARPSRRAYHACTWDTKRHQLWSFGGSTSDFKGLDDLWSFDPEARAWKKLDPPNPRPKGRLSATLHYYPANDSLVLFGGLSGFAPGSPAVRDLWVYDIKANRWAERKCAAPQLWQCASALDPKRGLLILHSGFDEKFQVRSETWVYDIGADKWHDPVETRQTTDAHSGVWDAAGGQMLVYGGARFEKGATGHDTVRAFDPEKRSWRQLKVKGARPPGRAYHSAVWEPQSRSMIVFGGTANQFSDPPRENAVWVLRLPAK